MTSHTKARRNQVVSNGLVFSTLQTGSGGYGVTMGLARNRAHIRHPLIAFLAACRALGTQNRSRTLFIIAVNPPCIILRWASANTSSVKRCLLGSSIGCFTSRLSARFCSLPPTRRIPYSSRNGCSCVTDDLFEEDKC